MCARGGRKRRLFVPAFNSWKFVPLGRAVTGLPIVIAEDLIEETANTGGFLAFSGAQRRPFSGRQNRSYLHRQARDRRSRKDDEQRSIKLTTFRFRNVLSVFVCRRVAKDSREDL